MVQLWTSRFQTQHRQEADLAQCAAAAAASAADVAAAAAAAAAADADADADADAAPECQLHSNQKLVEVRLF